MAIKNVVLVGAHSALTSTKHSNPPPQTSTSPSSPDQSTSRQPEGAKIIRLAYDDPTLVDAPPGQDAIVSAVNGMATLSQIPLIDAAAKAAVGKFIPSEFGSDTLNPIVPALFGWYQDMKTVYEQHLVAVSSTNQFFSFCGLITGLLFDYDYGLKTGILGYGLENHAVTILDGGDLQVSSTDIPQAALAVGRVLEKDVKGYLKISSVTCSQNEILASLEKASGKKWQRKEETTQHNEEVSEEMMKSEDGKMAMEGAVMSILRIAYGEDSKPN